MTAPLPAGGDRPLLPWLGAHLDHPARTGYVEVRKAFVGRRPRTAVKASPQGPAAFARHVAFLKATIAGAWALLL